MACGNNKVSRDYLSSQPSSPSQHGQRLFNETTRASGKVAVVNAKGKLMTVAQKYSDVRRDGTVHRFLDENRNATLNTSLHIHEIHKPDGDVELHITDRRSGGAAKHTNREVLKQASGNQVNAAEQRLAGIMRSMKRS